MVSFTNLLAFSVAAAAATAVHAQTPACSDVHLVWARGTFEAAGLGKDGSALFEKLTAVLPDKTVSAYAVNYSANVIQTSAGPGASDMAQRVVSYAASCPNAVFVIGGFSQGATVTDIAIGLDTVLGKGEAIPAALAPRIKAVVTFGNPIRIFGKTIAKDSVLYGAKSVDYCNKNDPFCGNGINPAAHYTYHTTAVPEAASRAAVLVRATRRNLRNE